VRLFRPHGLAPPHTQHMSLVMHHTAYCAAPLTPVTVLLMCITWLYRSISISFSTTTLPDVDTWAVLM
jgi:hypothetical protein